MAIERTYRYSEVNNQSTQSTTNVDVPNWSVTFTPNSGETWLILALFSGGHNNQTPDFVLTDGSNTQLDYQEGNFTNSGSRFFWGLCYLTTYGASPGQQTYKVRFRSNDATRPTTVYGGRLVALKLEANDKSVFSSSGVSTSSTTFVDALTLNTGSIGAGDYLILCGANCGNQFSADRFTQQLNIDGTAFGGNNGGAGGNNNGSRTFNIFAHKVTLAAGTHTIKLQHKLQAGSGTAYINNQFICLLALSDFADTAQDSYSASAATSSTSLVDALSMTQTAVARPYLELAVGRIYSTGNPTVTFNDGEDTNQIDYPFAVGADTSDALGVGFLRVSFKSAASTTWKVQQKTSTGTITTEDLEIVALPLNTEVAASVAAGADDGHATTAGASFQNGASVVSLGRDSFGTWDTFFRFTGLTIPQGATITSAVLRFYASTTSSGTGVALRFRAWAADNPSAPGTAAAVIAGPFTTAVVDWAPNAWGTASITYDSPDLVALIQEVISRSGWVSGNALILDVVDNGGTGTSSNRVAATVEGSHPAQLLVSYVAAGGSTPVSLIIPRSVYRTRTLRRSR